MEYIFVTLALLATIAGVYLKTLKDDRLVKIIGKIIIAIAVLAFLGNIYKIHEGEVKTQKLQITAFLDIHDGISYLCSALLQMKQDEELVFIDFMNYDRAFDILQEPEFIKILQSIDLESKCWWVLINPPTVKEKLNDDLSKGTSSLDDSIKKFNSCLNTEIKQEISAICKHAFIKQIRNKLNGPILYEEFEEETTDYLDFIKDLQNLNKRLCKNISQEQISALRPDLLK